MFTPNANAYFTQAAIDEYTQTLDGLGALESLEQTSSGSRGGLRVRRYAAKYATKTLTLSVFETLDGKLEQFLIEDDG